MKTEHFHCTIYIYPDLPSFHTWPSHSGPAIFASIAVLLCNPQHLPPNIPVCTTSTCFRTPASPEEAPLWEHVTSHKFPNACDIGYCHWRENNCQFYLHLSKSTAENSLTVEPVAFWSPIGMFHSQEWHGVSNNQHPAESKLSSGRD